MAFDPQEHLIKVKGGQLYLEVRWRLIWFRELHPDASIEVELTHLDLDSKLAIARATVTLPNGTKATEIGSETERDFPAGWVEKAATKAVGRALAALGFGTQFALELDEGDAERPADSPVAARNGSAGSTPAATRPAATAAVSAARAPASAPVVAQAVVKPATAPAPLRKPEPKRVEEQRGSLPRSAADWTGDQLRSRIEEKAGGALKTGKDWKALAREHGVPEPTSAAELGSRTWLLGLYQALRCAEYQEMIASVQASDPDAEERVSGMAAEALAERDRRCIGRDHYDAVWARGKARKAELAAPLLSGTAGRAQVTYSGLQPEACPQASPPGMGARPGLQGGVT